MSRTGQNDLTISLWYNEYRFTFFESLMCAGEWSRELSETVTLESLLPAALATPSKGRIETNKMIGRDMLDSLGIKKKPFHFLFLETVPKCL